MGGEGECYRSGQGPLVLTSQTTLVIFAENELFKRETMNFHTLLLMLDTVCLNLVPRVSHLTAFCGEKMSPFSSNKTDSDFDIKRTGVLSK